MVPLFEQLAENIDVLEGPHAVALVQSALNMLVTVFASELDSQPGMNSENLLFEQAQQFIDQNIGNSELGPQISPMLCLSACVSCMRVLLLRRPPSAGTSAPSAWNISERTWLTR